MMGSWRALQMADTEKTGKMKLIYQRLEGALLLSLGAMLAYFASSNLYQTLLNPRFALLSGLTGGGLILLGLVLLRWPLRIDPLRTLSFGIVIAMFGLVISRPLNQSHQNGNSFAPVQEAREEFPSRELKAGKEYIRINLGELFDIAEVGKPQQRSQHYLVRGYLRPSYDTLPPLLTRTAISCCLADAVSVGFYLNPITALPSQKQWVNVYGVLEPYAGGSQNKDLQLPGLSFTSIHSAYRFRADLIEPIKPPEVPFMFEFRQQEPYAF